VVALAAEGLHEGAVHPVSDEVVFHLDRGDLRIPLEIGLACGFAVSTFGSPLPPGVYWPETHRLGARLESLPPKAHSGEEVRFVAVVSNPTPGPVRLEPCPGYRVAFERPGGVEISHVDLALNCDTARMIPPEARGNIELSWTLIGGDTPAIGHVLVEGGWNQGGGQVVPAGHTSPTDSSRASKRS
jgi:hypothetical protein